LNISQQILLFLRKVHYPKKKVLILPASLLIVINYLPLTVSFICGKFRIRITVKVTIELIELSLDIWAMVLDFLTLFVNKHLFTL